MGGTGVLKEAALVRFFNSIDNSYSENLIHQRGSLGILVLAPPARLLQMSQRAWDLIRGSGQGSGPVKGQVLQSHIPLLGPLQMPTDRRVVDPQMRGDLGQPIPILPIRLANNPIPILRRNEGQVEVAPCSSFIGARLYDTRASVKGHRLI
jgi:hypothetical protein